MFSNVFCHLRLFDAYPKTLEDFRIRTYGGAFVSVVSWALIAFLTYSEFAIYLTPQIRQELLVDTTRGKQLLINIDVIFHKLSCSWLTIDAIDISGAQHINIRHNMFKRRLDNHGNPIEDPQKQANVGEVSSNNVTTTTASVEKDNATKCGSCYGAENDKIKCCNTCADIKEAYRLRGWAIGDALGQMEQCVNDPTRESLPDEGCHIFGSLEVNKVGGNFHISPGKSYQQQHVHVHDVQPYLASDFNMTHTLNHVSFGQKLVDKHGPLDGWYEFASQGAVMFQYYVKIVPTMLLKLDNSVLYSNEFSVTQHRKVVGGMTGEQGLPGVFFVYEFAPVMVKYVESSRSFIQFLTSLCAIVGGIYTVASIADRVLYKFGSVIQKKLDLGKLG